MSETNLQEKAKLVRKWCLISTSEAGSGHPTSCLSAADIGTVLFGKYFTYDLKNPLNEANDRFILSKGHAAPLLYTLFAMSGAMPLEELKMLRKFGSPLEGHPMPGFPYSDAATGSLGQGLSVGAGLAYLAQKEKLPYKTYVLMGDGELAEGQVWEAANFASYYKLNNLIAIADINGLGQSQETMFRHSIDEYVSRFRAFGFEVLAIDGHNLSQIDKAFNDALHNETGKPYAIIAKTAKGKGISFLEDKDNWHGKPLKKEDLEKALKELGEVDNSLRFNLHTRGPVRSFPTSARSSLPSRSDGGQRLCSGGSPASVTPRSFQIASPASSEYRMGEEIATREVYGQVLAEIAKKNPDIYALDGDVKNSTFSQDFKNVHPERFVECFIAEQNMVGVATGFSRLQKIPFVSTFASFFTRAADQIRMAAIGQANIKFVGSHAGVSIGEDGASQMGLEDIALFGTLPDTVVLHPSDAVSTAKLIPQMVSQKGLAYLRTLRPKTPVIYKPSEAFSIGGSKILRQSKDDILTVVAAGITVHEALKAYEMLKKDGISVQIIDCYSINPIDKETLVASVRVTKQNMVITVEDHFEHGGLGDFVLEALSGSGTWVEKMAVSKISHSGKQAELLHDAMIDADCIVAKVRELSS